MHDACMASYLTAKTGRVDGGSIAEKFTMLKLWCISWCFVPLAFRGFWRVSRTVQAITKVKGRQWVVLPSGLRLSIDLADPYWNRLISPRFAYEPELHSLLEKLRDKPFHFIDCGANMGYWSCMLASGLYGEHHVSSIEPLNENMKLLKEHLDANQAQATCYHNAVTETSGETLNLYKPGGHASVSLNAVEQDAEAAQQVTTITLDDVYSALPDTTTPIFVKLDVEGHEVEALKGATALLQANPLIFYEDHGQDKESVVSQYVLETLGYKVIHITDVGEMLTMDNVADVNALKSDITKGYNFAAFDPESHWKF